MSEKRGTAPAGQTVDVRGVARFFGLHGSRCGRTRSDMGGTGVGTFRSDHFEAGEAMKRTSLANVVLPLVASTQTKPAERD